MILLPCHVWNGKNIFVVAFNKLTFSVLEIIFDATEQAGVRALVSVGWVCHDTFVVYISFVAHMLINIII